jgi:AcrR family transcriptional regulator
MQGGVVPRSRLTQEERKAKTREALIAAATRLFAKRGVEATSLDDIAEEAGYTKGAIYANFRNKRALFEAVIERHLVQIDPAPLLRADLSLPDRLAIAGRQLAEISETISRETVLLDMEARLDWFRNPKSRARWGRVGTQWPDFPAQFIALNEAQGAEPAVEIHDLMRLMGILGRGILLGLAENPGALSPKTIETLFRLLGGRASKTTGQTAARSAG